MTHTSKRASRKVVAGDETIAGYWMMHGYTEAEALRIERDQIREAMEREALFDSMENDPF
jgi:hypothetical protein